MSLYRKTAIVQLELPSGASAERLPLTADRAYGVILTIDGQSFPATYFSSPINDDQWRDFSRRLSDCNIRHVADATAYRNATFIRGIGQALYKELAGLSPQLQAFLDEAGGHRRLVIQTTRPELHLLPWGALYSGGGSLLAAGNLSIVQSYDSFSASLAVTQSRLNLLRVEGTDTNFATAFALKQLPPEIVPLDPTDTRHPDILHVEAHGDRVTNQIGDVSAVDFGHRYGKATIALLWSCYSSSANSWGDSPALCLHQAGALMVLSFQAELHVLDATSLAEGLYGDVFGPAASRNPESALVRIRADKFANEFAFANWASMTVYLRCPLDLSALPLNGPRVPAAQWLADLKVPDAATPGVDVSTTLFVSETNALASRPFAAAVAAENLGDDADAPDDSDAPSEDDGLSSEDPTFRGTASTSGPAPGLTADPWAQMSEEVRKLQPGSWKSMALPIVLDGITTKLPMSAFGAWRGNVIRLDGCDDPLTQQIFLELDLLRLNPPSGDPAERLVWFFEKIAHYGSPLIVWTNSLARHMEFLNTIAPSPALTFLLLSGATAEDTIPSLVDQNRLEEACTASELLLKSEAVTPDEVLSAAYFTCVRGSHPEIAQEFLLRVASFQEWLLLTGNLFSRDKKNVLGTQDLIALGARFLEGDSPSSTQEQFEQLHRPEDFYRLAMNQPLARSSLRETGRAKHELAYLLQSQGRPGTAEVFYRLALTDLEACNDTDENSKHDSRWHFAMGAVLRDLADLLSTLRERVPEASALLKRAMAIQSYHGLQLQLGYSETTSARIWLTGAHHSHAINQAVNAANRMEQCVNWSGWGEALEIIFDSLAGTRETTRMINLANLANAKIRSSNLSKDRIARQERVFKYEKAKAHWIAGDMVEARDELEGVRSEAPEEEKSDIDREIDRLLLFLRVERPAVGDHETTVHRSPTRKAR